MKLAKQETETQKKPENKKKLNSSAGSPLNWKVIILGAIGVILTITVCVIIAFEQLYEPTLVKINDDKYQLSDMKYSIFAHEMQGRNNELTYQNYFQTSYLDQIVDEETGETNLDQLKARTMDDFVEMEILYKEAVKQGYSVSDEDKSNVKTTIDALKEQVDPTLLRQNGLTDSYLKKAMQKEQIVSRFQQDTIDGFDIDDDAIKDGIDYEEHHQYELGVFTVNKTKEVETTGDDTSETGEKKTETLSEQELKEAYQSLEALKETVASSKELDSILDEEEKIISYTSDTIKKDSTTYGKKNVKKILQMKDGEVSDILETKDAYYLVKMINNKATTEYDSEVSSAITQEENKQFEDYLEKVKEGYTVKESKGDWEDLNFGYITMDIYGGY